MLNLWDTLYFNRSSYLSSVNIQKGRDTFNSQ
jgi:hypothetical protein